MLPTTPRLGIILLWAIVGACSGADRTTAPPPPAAVDITGRWTGSRSISTYDFTLEQTGDTVVGDGLQVFSLDFGDTVIVDTFHLAVLGGVHGTRVRLTYWPQGLPEVAHVLDGEAGPDVIVGREYSVRGPGYLPLELRRRP